MVTYVFGDNPNELLVAINKHKIGKKDIVQIIHGDGIWLCYYEDNGREKHEMASTGF